MKFKLYQNKLNKKVRMDIKKLEKENRYYDIYEKYPFYTNYRKAMNFDSKIETGKNYSDLKYRIRELTIYNSFKKIKQDAIKALICCFIGPHIALLYLSGLNCLSNYNTYKFNKEIITQYDDNLEEYASQFDTNTMSDMEIIMTVMNDIRSNTQYGFDFDETEIYNRPRVVLNDNNNIGVCRHMADKFTTIMNMINPDYEAYNLAVYLDAEYSKYTPCNIDRPLSDKFKEDLENDENNNESTPELEKKLLANHMVSILKPIGKKYYLVVDVTNPSIGVLKDGKIYMFNANDYSFIEYRPIFQYITSINGSYTNVMNDFLSSKDQNIDLDELNKLYGLKQQNKVLEKIKN